MTFYAIYDPDSDLYLTADLQPKLDKLGKNTQLFISRSEAERRIQIRRHGLDTTILQNDLAFWLLEKVYKKDIWSINVSFDEFMDACSQFKNLRVEELCLERQKLKRK